MPCAWRDPAHELTAPISSTEVQRDPSFVSKQKSQQWASVPIVQDLLTASSKEASDTPCSCSRKGPADGLWAIRPQGEPCVEWCLAFYSHFLSSVSLEFLCYGKLKGLHPPHLLSHFFISSAAPHVSLIKSEFMQLRKAVSVLQFLFMQWPQWNDSRE